MNFFRSRYFPVCSFLLVLLQLSSAQQVSFRITPVRPMAELRAEAIRKQPPQEQGTFLKPDLVELVKLDPTIKLDIRYATTNNFLGTPVYTQARAFLQRPAAEALLRAHRELKAQGYGLIIHDGYRPWYITEIFWDAVPEDKKIFVADPTAGSKHNRGCAVDLSLYDLKTGREVTMPSGYDEMTPRAYTDYPGGTPEERERRAILRQAMEKQGFKVIPKEWWHFDYQDWKQYPILNAKFEDLGQ
jgi:zinc D-Ala-D-Ala dipeptidase